MTPIITYVIIAITCVISYLAFNDASLRSKLLFVPALVRERGEWYRFITHGFIHGDFFHLLFNMWALFLFGKYAEYGFQELFGQTLGGTAYLVFYLAAIAAASFVTYQRHQDNYGYTALGASGGVAAIIWPYVIFGPWSWIFIWFVPVPAIGLGIGYIAYSHYADQKGGSRIGHNAHLWGSIFGLVVYVSLCAVLRPEFLQSFWTQLLQPNF